MPTVEDSAPVPAPVAAAELRMSRERVVRAILVGKISGERRGGRYFVAPAEIARLKANEQASAA